MLKIISFTLCPFVQRVTAMLEALKVPYALEMISLKQKPDWFLALSPAGQVPVLVTPAGEALFESDAIVEYIDEVYGPLSPGLSAEERAKHRAWSYQGAKLYLSQCSAMRSRDEATFLERKAVLDKGFARIDGVLPEQGFFIGGSWSAVDIAWLPVLHRAAIIQAHTGFDFLVDFPRVKQWQQTLLATPWCEASVTDDFEGVFSEFYLSDETFLGQCSGIQAGKQRDKTRAVQCDSCC